MNEFVIDFIYERRPFRALVTPREQGSDIIYAVNVESQDPELNLDVVAILVAR